MTKDIQKAAAYFNAGNMMKAEHILQKVLKRHPHDMQAIHFLSQIALRKEDYDSAINYLKKAIDLNPTNSDHYNNLGFLLKGRGKVDEAIKYFREAIRYDKHFINAHYNLGNALTSKGCHDEAIACYRTVLQLNAKDHEAWNNLGNVLKDQDKLDEAITCYDKAVQINPRFSLAYTNMGTVFQEKGLFERAHQCYQQALMVDPRLISAINNTGVAFREDASLDQALTYFEKAISINPDDAEAHWNKAITCLLAGRYEEGWRHYEWRFRKRDISVVERSISKPRWNGENIRGKTILLYAEQGLGDTVQFIRYAPFVAQKGARVVVECQKELLTIVQHIQGVGEVIAKGKELPDFDVWAPLLSLPLLFATRLETIPANVPYLKVPRELHETWRQKILGDPPGFRVGLVWAGNPKYRHDRVRSFPPELLARLSGIQGIVLYSLQKEAAAGIAGSLFNTGIFVDDMHEVRDFSDTAALIQNLDLVISVDTAVAHVAGALGKEVWTLLRYAPDWRWLLNRMDSPWYPTMRLFRQQKIDDWKSVIDQVALELRKRCLC